MLTTFARLSTHPWWNELTELVIPSLGVIASTAIAIVAWRTSKSAAETARQALKLELERNFMENAERDRADRAEFSELVIPALSRAAWSGGVLPDELVRKSITYQSTAPSSLLVWVVAQLKSMPPYSESEMNESTGDYPPTPRDLAAKRLTTAFEYRVGKWIISPERFDTAAINYSQPPDESEGPAARRRN